MISNAWRCALLVLCLVLAGCGDGDDEDGASGGDESSDVPSSDPSDEDRTREEPITGVITDLRSVVGATELSFVGTAVAQTVERDERGLIITSTEFEIEDVLLGGWDESTVLLTTLGGTLGDEQLRVSHMPEFVEGFRYLIFASPSRETYDPVVGNHDGVFVVVDDAIFTIDGIAVADVIDGEIVTGTTALDEMTPGARGAVASPDDPDVDGGVTGAQAQRTPEAPPIGLADFVAIIAELA